MLNKKKFFTDSSWMMFANLFSSLVSMLAVMILARYLGVATYGKYSFAFTFVNLFYILARFGVDTLFVRDVARDPTLAKKYLQSIFYIKFILSVLVSSVIGLIVLISGKDIITKILVAIAVFSMFFDNFSFTIEALYQSYHRIKLKAIMLIVKNVLAIAFLGIFVFMHTNIYLVSAYLLISNAIYMWINMVFVKNKYFPPISKSDFSFACKLIIASLPFFSKMAFICLYDRSDTVILSFMRSDYEVGIYRAAYNFLFFVGFIPSALATVIFPIVSHMFHAGDQKRMQTFGNKCLNIFLFTAIPVSVFTYILAPQIINFIYSSKYIAAVDVLRVLVLAIPFIYLNYLYNNFLIGYNLQNKMVLFLGVGAGANIFLNLICIPIWGYYGAAWSTVASELIVLALSFWAMSKYLHLNIKVLHEAVKCVISGIVAGFIILYFHTFNFFILAFMAVASYIVAGYLLKIDAIHETISLLRKAPEKV